MIPLRQYQQQAIDAVRAALGAGKRRLVINLPTGTGKTITALSMVASSMRKGNRVLWIAHRDELIAQTAESFGHVAPDLAQPGIVKAAQNDIDKQFVIASIQTLWGKDRSVEKSRQALKQEEEREKLEALLEQVHDEAEDGGVHNFFEKENIKARLNALPPPSFPRWDALNPNSFKFVVYDECHHSVSPSAIKLMQQVDKDSLLLGLSATPFRGDNATLKQLFSDGIVYQLPLKTAIREGYLCDFKYQSIWLDLDLEKIKTTAGDYNAKELEAALDAAGVVEVTAQGIKQHAADRCGVVFTFTIAQAEATADRLNELGIPARAISDKTSKEDRKKTLHDLKTGVIKFIPNCAVLTEGWDFPGCTCVVIARPTKSKPLYIQMAGRGLRTAKGKTDCLLLDFVGVGKKNIPAGVVDLIGVIPEPEETSADAEKRLIAEDIAAGLPTDPVAAAMLKAAEAAKAERESWKAAWAIVRGQIKGVTEARVLSGRAKRKCVIWTEDPAEQNGDRNWKCAAWLPSSGGVYYLDKRGINLEFAESISRQAMRDMGQRGIFDASAMWRIRPPSRAALQFAQKCRIEVGENWTGGEVADAINSVTAGWDLKKLIANKEKELTFDTPEAFRAALRAERDASENEYEEKKEAKRQAQQEPETQQTEVPF